jgi:multicomponent Na+:H+ antiporter subunit C
MEPIFAILIGFLTAAGFYLMLRRTFMRLLLGFLLLGQAANLLILTAGGLGPGTSPIIRSDATTLPPGHPDPLPQALILTAIVIGFATVAFAVVLLKRANQATGTDDFDALDTTDS